MKIIQQYVRSATSSNLRDDAENHNTEILAAAAMASTKPGCELGTKLFRVKYAEDQTSRQALLDEWLIVVHKKSIIRNWPPTVSVSKVAKASLDYWLDGRCLDCKGRGRRAFKDGLGEEVKGLLENDPCPTCKGVAKRPISGRQDTKKYIEHMVDLLESMIIVAGGETMRKLAKEMDVL